MGKVDGIHEVYIFKLTVGEELGSEIDKYEDNVISACFYTRL